MKVLVAVKPVINAYVNIRVKSDQSGIETANVKMSMNPFDEIAVEEAVRLKEQKHIQEIIVVSLGSKTCQEILRSALAMGADKAIHIEVEESELLPLTVAKVLHALVKQHQIDIILMGKQAIDNDNNQVGQMLAGLMNCAQGTFASKVVIQDKQIEVTREIDGGLETLSLTLPAVITTDLRLNEPRYISLPNIMKAKQKPLTVSQLSDLGISLANTQKTVKVEPPAARKAGVKVASVAELLDKLKNEAKVIE